METDDMLLELVAITLFCASIVILVKAANTPPRKAWLLMAVGVVLGFMAVVLRVIALWSD